MTFAKQRYYQRLNTSLTGLLSTEGVIIAVKNPETGILEETGIVKQSDYVNVNQVASVRWLPLGTDNFGRDVLTELVTGNRRIAADRFCRRSNRNLDRIDPGIAGGLCRRPGG